MCRRLTFSLLLGIALVGNLTLAQIPHACWCGPTHHTNSSLVVGASNAGCGSCEAEPTTCCGVESQRDADEQAPTSGSLCKCFETVFVAPVPAKDWQKILETSQDYEDLHDTPYRCLRITSLIQGAPDATGPPLSHGDWSPNTPLSPKRSGQLLI